MLGHAGRLPGAPARSRPVWRRHPSPRLLPAHSLTLQAPPSPADPSAQRLLLLQVEETLSPLGSHGFRCKIKITVKGMPGICPRSLPGGGCCRANPLGTAAMLDAS